MPTHAENARFVREWLRLTPEQKARFKIALDQFIEGLRSGQMAAGLRVKRYQRQQGTFEMTWADDGRALFRYGPEVHSGDPHVEWLRIGTHDIFD